MSTKAKLIVFFILLIIISFIFLGGFSYIFEKKRISEQEIEELRKTKDRFWDAEVQDIERLEREIGEEWRGRE